MSKRFHIVLNGKSYEAEVEEMSAYPKEMVATSSPVGGASPAPVQSAPVAAAAPLASGAGKPFLAPLQGIVIGLQVKVGDAVKAGDCLLKIEAMKMENEITADKDGTITKVYVSDGQQVKADDPLVDIG